MDSSAPMMVYHQLFMADENQEDGPRAQHDSNALDNLMQQNFSSNLMRQMQQQFAPLTAAGGAQRSMNPPAPALGSLQNGLNNLNTNMLMSAAFPGAAGQGTSGQNGQGSASAAAPFFDVQRAENILAAALAAANNNAAAASNGGGGGSSHAGGPGVGPPGVGQSTQQQQMQSQQHLQQSAAAAFGLEGLDQFRDFNPLQQAAAAAANQQNANTGFQSLGGLQQQLVNAQQQVQQQQQQQQHQQQQFQLQQQNQVVGVPQQGLQQTQAATGLPPWMTAQNVNAAAAFGDPASFLSKNSAALSSLTGGVNPFGDQSNVFQQDVFGGPVGNQQQSGSLPVGLDRGLLGGGGGNTAAAAAAAMSGLPFQGPPPKRRSSSLSSGSLSPIGKKGTVNGSTNQGGGGNSSFAHLFPPNLSGVSAAADSGVGNLANSNNSKQPRKEKKKRAKTFPEKLMQSMMEYADEDAVAWLPDGKSFVIVNPDLFCNEVLNKVFKESKYASFVRKLHRWGFVRLTSGTGTDCFHHPMFQRNRKEMASKISCTPRGDKDKPGPDGRPQTQGGNGERSSKPPSLAGVEKFIRAKVVAAAASAAADAEENMNMAGFKGTTGRVDSPGDMSSDDGDDL